MKTRLRAHTESMHWGHILLVRMRPFIALLLTAYALGTLIFWLIPATGPQGNFRVDLLDALYMVAITGTTIGFGEFPTPFNPSQRLFFLVYAHLVVVCWLFFAGGFIGAIQSTSFKRAFSTWNFRRRVRRLDRKYMVVVGYGQTGLRVVDYLTDYDIPCVVIDRNPLKIQHLDAVDFKEPVLGHVGDGSDPRVLEDAGALRAQCVAVVALTDSDRSNLGVATAMKLLAPSKELFVRSEHDDTTRNLLSFGTDQVLDPYRLFARSLVLRVTQPLHYAVADQLLDPGQKHIEVPATIEGNQWVLCGYGRLGRAIHEAFTARGLVVNVVDPSVVGDAPRWTRGLGTEEHTLRAADLEHAAGIIAGTNHDPDNLSIWMTARSAQPQLVGVGRINRPMNTEVFEKAKWDGLMNPADVIAEELVGRLRTPMLKAFIVHLESQPESWVRELIARVEGLGELETWDVKLSASRAPATYRHLLESPKRQIALSKILVPGVVCLKVRQGDGVVFTPFASLPLNVDDRLLFWGRSDARSQMLEKLGA